MRVSRRPRRVMLINAAKFRKTTGLLRRGSALPRRRSLRPQWSTQPAFDHAALQSVATGQHDRRLIVTTGTERAALHQRDTHASVSTTTTRHASSTSMSRCSSIHPQQALDPVMLPSLVIAPRLSPVGLFSEEDVVSADFVFTLSCTRSSDALPGLAPFRSATVSPSCV